MIKMSTLIPLPAFNAAELGKVMADSRVRAFSPVVGQDYSSFNEDHGYSEAAPVSRREGFSSTDGAPIEPDQDNQEVPSIDEPVDANSIPQEQADRLFAALKLQSTNVDPAQFYAGINAELEHYNITRGDLKKIALITLAHLAQDPQHYSKSQDVSTDSTSNLPENGNNMSLSHLLQKATSK